MLLLPRTRVSSKTSSHERKEKTAEVKPPLPPPPIPCVKAYSTLGAAGGAPRREGAAHPSRTRGTEDVAAKATKYCRPRSLLTQTTRE